MLFNSLEFLVFFPIVCIIYFLIPSLKIRNFFLLVASYYFYMNWEPVYALLLLSSTGLTWLCGLFIDKYKNRKKTYLTICIILNLAILFFFKYYQFAAENITSLMNLLGISIKIPDFKVLLPVGISFYIFQALGYSIDVYRGDVKVERNFFRYALFVSFFPQLVAGPIERSTNLLQQFYVKHKFDADRAISGINLMLWGFFMKLVLADRCAIIVNTVYNNIDNHTGSTILLASAIFCFQLYGDFAGYSYIAIGAAKVMGFKLMDNFKHPYFFSVSVQDYWKRNHISLTTWFMDYIYYPMVGSSTKLWWWCLSIFITFVISGFWHGAAWTYVLSFAIFGFFLVICILKDKPQRKFEKKHNLKKKAWWLWLNRFVTFWLVCFALIFFRANNIDDAFTAIVQVLTNCTHSIFTGCFTPLPYVIFSLFVLFVVEYVSENQINLMLKNRFLTRNILYSTFLIICILSMGIFDGSQFIYFQF